MLILILNAKHNGYKRNALLGVLNIVHELTLNTQTVE